MTTNESGDQADGEAFVADISEVVVTALDPAATKLVIESWSPSEGDDGSSGTSPRTRLSAGAPIGASALSHGTWVAARSQDRHPAAPRGEVRSAGMDLAPDG